jgi:hypothetical protein
MRYGRCSSSLTAAERFVESEKSGGVVLQTQKKSPERLCETFVTRCDACVKAEQIYVSDYLR